MVIRPEVKAGAVLNSTMESTETLLIAKFRHQTDPNGEESNLFVMFVLFPWPRNDYMNERFPFIDLVLLMLPGHGINRNVALESDAKAQ
jgi:hypothetical protein